MLTPRAAKGGVNREFGGLLTEGMFSGVHDMNGHSYSCSPSVPAADRFPWSDEKSVGSTIATRLPAVRAIETRIQARLIHRTKNFDRPAFLACPKDRTCAHGSELFNHAMRVAVGVAM